MKIARVDHTVLEQAIEADFQDFEDAVQFACAITSGLDAIVTRNPTDFKQSTLPRLTPRELHR
jgi:predicted nucleic acid-binding protein